MKKLTNAEIDKRLINISRLVDFDNSKYHIRSHVDWKCLICGFIWNTQANHLINDNSGCPNCVNRARITNSTIDLILETKNIERLTDITDNMNGYCHADFKCKICNYKWKAILYTITRTRSSGCPKCARVLKLNNNLIDEKLESLKIKRLTDFNNNKTNVRTKSSNWKCLDCNYIWPAAATAIINRLSGCPKCSLSRSKGERIIMNYLEDNYILYNLEYKIIPNKRFLVDFYIEKYNLVIEYNGLHHYQAIKFGSMSKEDADKKFIYQKKRDKKIRAFCNANNIKLLEIDSRYLNILKYDKLEKQIADILENYFEICDSSSKAERQDVALYTLGQYQPITQGK